MIWLLLEMLSNAKNVETLSNPRLYMILEPVPAAPVQLMGDIAILDDVQYLWMISLT